MISALWWEVIPNPLSPRPGSGPKNDDQKSADFVAFSLRAAGIQVVCTRAIPRVWSQDNLCTGWPEVENNTIISLLSYTTEEMSVYAPPPTHQPRHTRHCPSVGNDIRALVISHSRPILPYIMFTKSQRPMEDHPASSPTNRHEFTPVVSQTKYFPNQKLKDDRKLMNETVKLHEVGERKWRMLAAWKLGNWWTHIKKVSTLPTVIIPPGNTEIRTRNPSRDRRSV